jgi:putative peptidoglycan lipid II flippase
MNLLRPSHTHTAFTATLLLMGFSLLSSLMGLVRTKYIAWLFGSGMEADALTAAFNLPDQISYFLTGAMLSTTLVTILTRYREDGRVEAGFRSLSIILSTMFLVLGTAVVAGEYAAPLYVHIFLHGFNADPAKAALCVRLTRILLPAQLCFFAGGVCSAVAIAQKKFTVQGFAPLIYNLGTIVGGVLLVHRLGVSALALGTLAGAFCGNFLLNALFAYRLGLRYRFILDWKDEGLREWVRMTLPLMAGISLVAADPWIISYFASTTDGAIALMNYAKRLFAAPLGMLAAAAGVASQPFFASLWAKGQRFEFATEVADSVSRIVSLGLLAASGMVALALPLVDLIWMGGRFNRADAQSCAVFFAIYTLSLCLWSAQSMYSRAFYAAGNTLLPMIAATAVTVVSIPIYAVLYRWYGAMGLAIASDLGIALQTVCLAVLLHSRRMVSIASLDFKEMGRCLLAGVTSGAAVWAVFIEGPGRLLPLLRAHLSVQARWTDIVALIAGTVLWLLIAKWVLEKSGSALPRVTMKRLGMG